MPTTPAAPVTHRLEAFRDAKTDAVEARGEDAKHDPRRPKTLADIYRRPAEICFNGEAAPPPHPGPYRPAAPAPGCPRLVLMLRCCRMQARSTSCGRRGESRAAGSSSTSSRPPSSRRSSSTQTRGATRSNPNPNPDPTPRPHPTPNPSPNPNLTLALTLALALALTLTLTLSRWSDEMLRIIVPASFQP